MFAMLNFSANLGLLWPELALLQRIEAAAKAGFKWVELHSPYKIPAADIRRSCQEYGLELVSINTPNGRDITDDFGLAALPGREEEFLEGLKLAANYARCLGAKMIHVMAGNLPANVSKAEATATFLANLRLASALAPDLNLLLEPLNARDRPAYFYSTVDSVADLIEQLNLPNLGLMFDAYHVGMAGENVIDAYQRHRWLIAHIQVAGVPHRHEPDHGPDGGQADMLTFLHLLDAENYTQPIGLEYAPRQSTEEGLGFLSPFQALPAH